MKKLLILLLLAFLIFIPSCSDTSDEVDPETEAAVEAVSGEAVGIAYLGMFEAMMTSPSVENHPLSGYTGVTITGSYSQDGDVITATYTITFTNYTSGDITINGTITLSITGNDSTGEYTMTISGDLTSVYLGKNYVMDFSITMEVTSTQISITGYVECNGYKVTVNETQTL